MIDDKGYGDIAPYGSRVNRTPNLDRDIGETTNVADMNPEVVKRLPEHVARMDGDLGISKNGPGVRTCGKVDNPKPLVKDVREYQ